MINKAIILKQKKIILGIIAVIFLVVAVFLLFSNDRISSLSCGEKLNYMDYSYKTIEIDGKCFFQENLRTDKYRNGEEINHVIENERWQETKGGAFSYYENDFENYSYLGNLYNFYATNNPLGICPEGWRVLTDEDWIKLEEFYGMCSGNNMSCSEASNERGKDEKIAEKLMKEDGLNIYFTGLRNPNGTFLGENLHAYFWTSTERSDTHAWIRNLRDKRSGIYRLIENKNFGAAVRCVKDL